MSEKKAMAVPGEREGGLPVAGSGGLRKDRPIADAESGQTFSRAMQKLP